MPTITLSRRQGIQLAVCAMVFGLVLRAMVGMLYYNTFDLAWYRTWALELQNGFFDCYARMMEGTYALDYPPVYLVFLFLVGRLYGLLPIADYEMTDMLAMKFFPILFDVLAAGMLYLSLRRHSEIMGVAAAFLWALNPSAIFNCAAWGQTDGMMIFLLLLAFTVVEGDRPVLGSVLFAVAVLTKMQSLYFAPAIILFLLRRRGPQRTVICAGAAMATGVAAFLPFIIGSWRAKGWMSILLPFEVYFGGLGKYPYAALNTYNLYGLPNLNWVWDGQSILFGTYDAEMDCRTGGFTIHLLGLILTVAALALLVAVMLRGRRDHDSLWIGGFLFMQCVFMLATRMHERYQLAVLPFALILFVRLCSWRWLWMYISLSLVTLVNQFMLLIRNNTINDPAAPWNAIFHPVQTVFSAVNLLLFAWSVYEVCRYAFSKNYPMPVYTAVIPAENPESHQEVSP